MTAEILAKYGVWSMIEQHCESLNLRFPTKLLTGDGTALVRNDKAM